MAFNLDGLNVMLNQLWQETHQPYSFFSTASRKYLQMMVVRLAGFSAPCFCFTTDSRVSWSQSSIPSRLQHHSQLVLANSCREDTCMSRGGDKAS